MPGGGVQGLLHGPRTRYRGVGVGQVDVEHERRGEVAHQSLDIPVVGLASEHRQALDAIGDRRARLDRLCELNVMRQVRNVASDVFVQDAWARGQALAIHGWVYSLSNGLVTDLNVTASRPEP